LVLKTDLHDLHNNELNPFNSRSKPRNKKTTRRWLFWLYGGGGGTV